MFFDSETLNNLCRRQESILELLIDQGIDYKTKEPLRDELLKVEDSIKHLQEKYIVAL